MQDALTIFAQAQELIAAYRNSVERDKENLEPAKESAKSKTLKVLNPKTSIQKPQRLSSLLSAAAEPKNIEHFTQEQQRLSSLLADMDKSFNEFSGPIGIIFFAMDHPEFAEFCNRKEFSRLWENYLLHDGCCILTEPKKIFLQPQPAINSFQLVLGYFLFHGYQQEEDPNKQHTLLKKAKAYDDFRAMQRTNDQLLKRCLYESDQFIELLDSEIELMAKKHGAPGFIEGAIAYAQLGMSFFPTNEDRAHAFFFKTLSYRYAAEFCALQSKAAINNTFGDTMENEEEIQSTLKQIEDFLGEDGKGRAQLTGSNLANQLYLSQLEKDYQPIVTSCRLNTLPRY